MGSGQYRLYLEKHDPAHDTWPAPPPPPSDSLPRLPAVEDTNASNEARPGAGHVAGPGDSD